MSRSRPLRRAVTILLVLVTIAGLGLSAVHQRGTAHATRELGPALRRLEAPEGLGAWPDVHEPGAVSALAPRLEALAAESPSPEAHTAASIAWQALGDEAAAVRHAELAARLAPGDADVIARRDRIVDLALVGRMRSRVKPFAWFSGLALAFLGVRGLMRRLRDGARRRSTRALVVRAAVVADGERLAPGATLPDTDDMAVDVFIEGLRTTSRPGRGPRLELVFSHAGGSRTVRLTPLKDVRHAATRIPLGESARASLLATPGTWRLHASLDGLAATWVPLRTEAVRTEAGKAVAACRGWPGTTGRRRGRVQQLLPPA
ncbi:MAG: hypothetical protein AB7T63_10720 [Planctomycetota bacterium]